MTTFIKRKFRTTTGAALPALAVLLAAAPAVGHHAFSAEFDAARPIELRGTVTRVRWVNPHSWLYLDVADADGVVTNWGVEFGAPASLARVGLTRADVPVGSEIRISGYLAKNGGHYGYTARATLADGRSFLVGEALGAPADAAEEKP